MFISTLYRKQTEGGEPRVDEASLGDKKMLKNFKRNELRSKNQDAEVAYFSVNRHEKEIYKAFWN
jgi:hypothetical protein